MSSVQNVLKKITKTITLHFSWTEDLEDLKEQRNRLLGDCLLGAAFLSYLGAFSWDFRNDLLRKEWEQDIIAKEIPKSEPFKVNFCCFFIFVFTVMWN